MTKVTLSKNRLDFIQAKFQEASFFQLMRLLELYLDNAEKIIQLKSTNDLQFSPNEIKAVTIQKNSQKIIENIILSVTFMGIAGTQGGLPIHYTEQFLQQLHQHENALVDFLDIFNHRSLTLFYKSWQKNHFFAGYEKSKKSSEYRDLFTQMLQSLTGIGTTGFTQSFLTSPAVMLFHSGHYAHTRRSATALSQILSCYFAFPIRVQEWQGEWLALSDDKCTTLNQNNRLGINTIAGKKIWSAQHKIRLRIGPIQKKDIAIFNPNGEAYKILCTITREFIGPTLKFDLQLIVKSSSLSTFQLHANYPTHLGWDTWLKSDSMPEEVHDIVLKEENCYE